MWQNGGVDKHLLEHDDVSHAVTETYAPKGATLVCAILGQAVCRSLCALT